MTANSTKNSSFAGVKSLDELLEGTGIKSSDIIDEVEYNSNMQYHEFEDYEDGSHEYDDDPYDEELFFALHSNYESLIDDMSDDEKEDFQEWAEGWFMDGQIYRGFSNMSGTEQKMVRTYDKYLDRSYINEGITLSRRATPELLGLSKNANPSLEQLKRMRGKLIVSKGNLSTAAAQTGLTIGYGGEKPIEYKIHIPEGARGAGMWIGDYEINGWGGKQREFMTNRDSMYVIGNSTIEKRPTYDFFGMPTDRERDVQVVHLYYVGRLPHDYS